MNLLLDSHILLWYDRGSSQLSADLVQQLRSPQHRVMVSVATIWELSIKRTLGKLPGTGSIHQMVVRNKFQILPILPEHAEGVMNLPRHHNDPFDHLLMAQAVYEGLTLVTADRTLTQYQVPLLVV